MKPPRPSPVPFLEIGWRTPVGRMEGLLGPSGWMALSLPPEPEQWLPPRPEAGVEWIWLGWPAGRGYWKPTVSMLAEVERLTAFLSDFFAGRPPRVRPRIGLAARSPFEQAVWQAARAVPHGRTITYGELARRVGRPGGARAVGQVMRRNPLVLLMPCHRVLAAGRGSKPRDGSRLGGFSGGLAMKRCLLGREGSIFVGDDGSPQPTPPPGAPAMGSGVHLETHPVSKPYQKAGHSVQRDRPLMFDYLKA